MSSTLKPTKVYVLTIPRLLERQEIFREAWEYCNLEINFYEGYDYKDYIDYNINNVFYERNIPQLIIASSFYKLFKYLLSTPEDRWFICEDDARPTYRWYNFNWEMLNNYTDTDIIKLYTYEFSEVTGREITVIDVNGTGIWIGACSFIITRTAIEKLFKHPLFYTFDRLITEVCSVKVLKPNIVVPYAKECSY